MTVRDVAVSSHVLLLLGVASERSESEASATPSSTAVEFVGQRGVLSRLSADGGAVGIVVGLVTVRDVVVSSHVLLLLGVASERVESEASPKPSRGP